MAGFQGALHAAALLSPAMVSTRRFLGGAILIIAGIYQWTPPERACLTSCRSPLTFVMTEWREGSMGAWIMGLRHGLYCVGCCWVLMALLFVAGVMKLAWVMDHLRLRARGDDRSAGRSGWAGGGTRACRGRRVRDRTGPADDGSAASTSCVSSGARRRRLRRRQGLGSATGFFRTEPRDVYAGR
jgi:hypothetical protein